MTIDEVMSEIQKYRVQLANATGKAVVFSQNGPANMAVIDALVSALEAIEHRVAAIENMRRAGGGSKGLE